MTCFIVDTMYYQRNIVLILSCHIKLETGRSCLVTLLQNNHRNEVCPCLKMSKSAGGLRKPIIICQETGFPNIFDRRKSHLFAKCFLNSKWWLLKFYKRVHNVARFIRQIKFSTKYK